MRLDDDPLRPRGIVAAVAFARGLRMIAWAMPAYCLALGAAILFSDDRRFSSSGYNIAEKLPGSPDTWGIAISVAGIVVVWGIALRRFDVVAAGMWIASVWNGLFATSFAISAALFPDANITAMFAYGLLCIVTMIAGIAFHSSKPRRQR